MARVPVLLSLESCLILVPVLIFGLRTSVVPLCAFLLGLIWCFCVLSHEQAIRDDLIQSEVRLVGQVIGLPVTANHGVRFGFRIIGGKHADASLRVYWYDAQVIVEPGQIWSLPLRLKPPTGSVNFNAFDYERWLFAKRVHALGYVDSQSDARLLDTRQSVDRIRFHVASRIIQIVPEEALPTFLALALGDTSQLKPDRWQVLNYTGTTHLLIVSGLHVGLMATLSFLVCRLLGVGYVTASIVTVLVASGYALLAGWGLPVQRALIMTIAFLSGGMLARHISMLSRLMLAAATVVLLDPLASLSAGFWLSFGVVAALILGLSNRTGYVRLGSLWQSQWVAFVALLPLLGGINHQLPLMSLPVNLMAIPLVGFVLVPLIFFALMVRIVSEDMGGFLLHLAQLVAFILWHALEVASGLGGLVQISALETWQVSCALMGATLMLMPAAIVPRWLGLPLLLVLLERPDPIEKGNLRLTFLDVGQGLSVLVESRHGVTLYDTGPSFPGSFSAAGQVVLPALRSRGWTHLDQLIISHTDNDHAGGKEEVLREVPVKRLIEQGACESSWERDGVWFYSFSVSKAGSSNDQSCQLLVLVDSRRILLTGDVESAGERALVDRLSVPMDVISVPHHGSETSSTPAFLNRLRPDIAVVSSGFMNRFGHPDAQVVERYENRSIRLESTALAGAVEIIVSSEGMMTKTARDESGGIWRRTGRSGQTGQH